MKSFLLGAVGLIAVAMCLAVEPRPEVAFPGAEGFGAVSRGGRGGRVLTVTRLDDDTKSPAEGTLRWAVKQPGPRVVKFGVAGTIALKGTLVVREPFLTIDGSDAPGDGICLRDHSLNFENTHDIVVRYIRIRRGDVETLKAVEAAGLQRPKGSSGLDCVSMDDSKNLIFDHCSLSWSADEVFGIVRCENVTIQWCLIAEPLANPRIHPYGDRHAFGLNLSANTLTLHHNLIAHFVMRGPQFEANDVRRGLGYDIKMEAINNVIFDYERSGSRYTTGIEDHPEEAAGTTWQFQFIGNTYVNPDAKKPEIEAVLKHGVVDRVKVHVAGNTGPHRPRGEGDEWAGVFTEKKEHIRAAAAEIRGQMAEAKLFSPPVPVTVETAAVSAARVLAEAGCTTKRDAVDERVLAEVRARKFGHVVKSQDEVGGWPVLK
ncbi:MAG: hypothetical protein NTV51_08380 [Verrucomicrobia bacterium]|nr:hypothetical protein [Verrucomicrobiota bacterium]